MKRIALLAAPALAVTASHAQYDPQNGLWGKDDPADLRVMTWNVQDDISTEVAKDSTRTSWGPLVRIVAALQPDILILQEAGGTSGAADTVSELETVIGMFNYGGTDIYNGGVAVLYSLAGYDPSYSLPHVFVSPESDGFNRNVILSRYPFADLNGDGISVGGDFRIAGRGVDLGWSGGGDGGIRGFGFAEIDLPDATYAGDVVIGNSHLKAFSDLSSYLQRVQAAQDISYFIQAGYNGEGTATADPRDVVQDVDGIDFGGTALDADTPVIWGGDWNNTPWNNYGHGGRTPDRWMIEGGAAGGTDGVDRDGTDAVYDDARQPISNSQATQSSSKLDYIAWQDSIATARHEFVFNTSDAGSSRLPSPITSTADSGRASDHRPVIVDFILPSPPAGPTCNDIDFSGDGVIDLVDLNLFVAAFGSASPSADLNADGVVDLTDLNLFTATFGACTGA